MISNTDVFIHQDIRSDNKYGYKLSDIYTKQCEKKECIDICIPNLFGSGRAFYPLVVMGNKYDHIYKNGVGLFPYMDTNINMDDTVEEVTNRFYKKDFIDSNFVEKNFCFHLEQLKEREKYCDIQISDFILENYRENRMFWDVGHPSNYVIKELCKRILEKMLCSANLEEIIIDNEMDTYQMPMYESVRYNLGIEWEDSILRNHTRNRLQEKMDTREWVEEYIYWCFEN